MKRKLFAVVLSCFITVSLVGCTSVPVNVDVSNSGGIYYNQFGHFVKIGGHLYYDPATRIVYIRNLNSYGSSYTPYYAPNGLPYRYDPETNMFEEINN